MKVVKILNPWIYNGVTFERNDLVEMSDSLFNHVFEVSVGEPVTHKGIVELFYFLVEGKELSEAQKEKLGFQVSNGKYHFRANLKVEGEENPRVFYFAINQDPAQQKLEG